MSKKLIIDTSIIVALWGAQEQGAMMSPLRFLLDKGIVDKIVIPAQVVFELTHVLPKNVAMFLAEVEREYDNLDYIARRYAQNNYARYNQSGFMPANAEEMLKFLAKYAIGNPAKVEVPVFSTCAKFQETVEAELDTLCGSESGNFGSHQLTVSEVLDILDIKTRRMKNLHVPGWMMRDTGILTDVSYKQNKDNPKIARLTLKRLLDGIKRKEKQGKSTIWDLKALGKAITDSEKGGEGRATLSALAVFSSNKLTEAEKNAEIKRTLKTYGRSWALSIDDAVRLGLLESKQLKAVVKLLGYKKQKRSSNKKLDFGFFEHIITVEDVKILAESGKFKVFSELWGKLKSKEGENFLGKKRKKFDDMVKSHMPYEEILLGAVSDGFLTLKEYLEIAVESGALLEGAAAGDYITKDGDIAVRLDKHGRKHMLFQKYGAGEDFYEREIKEEDLQVSSEVIKDSSRAMQETSLIDRASTANALSAIFINHWMADGTVGKVRQCVIDLFERKAKTLGSAEGSGKSLFHQLEFNYYLSRWRWIVRSEKKSSDYDRATAVADILRKAKNNIGDYAIIQSAITESEAMIADKDESSVVIVAANDNEIKNSIEESSLTDGHRINCLIPPKEKRLVQSRLAICSQFVEEGRVIVANREDIRLTLAALALIHKDLIVPEGNLPTSGDSHQSYDFLHKLIAARSVRSASSSKKRAKIEAPDLFQGMQNGSAGGDTKAKENSLFLLQRAAAERLQENGWQDNDVGWKANGTQNEVSTLWRNLVVRSDKQQLVEMDIPF